MLDSSYNILNAVLTKLGEFVNFYYEQLLTTDNTWESMIFFIKYGGWLAILISLFWGFKEAWLYWRQGIYYVSETRVLLAVDVPRENEQGPKAVENIFSHVYGSQKGPDLFEKYWDGFLSPRFSFEIISVGGYLQFLISTPVRFRDLIEAAIYAQYPDAEISEVEDYAEKLPLKFENTENNMWGCELVLYNDDVYPIRTYPAFEYGLDQTFKDPMASALEIMSKMSPDENMWLQLVITPITDEWTKKGEVLVKKLIGAKVPEKKPGFLYSATAGLAKGAWETAAYTVMPPAEQQQKKDDQGARSEMLFLSPGERANVEAIEAKISKNAFDTRFRFMYWGKRDNFSRSRGVNGMMGAIAQVNSLDLNGFKPHPKTKTRVYYFFIKLREEWRKQRLVAAYKARSNWRGWGHSTLNIEELATLWHFPMMDIRTPMLKKTQTRKVESPFALPVENLPLETQAPQDAGLMPQAPDTMAEIIEEPEIPSTSLPEAPSPPPENQPQPQPVTPEVAEPAEPSNPQPPPVSQPPVQAGPKKSGPPSNLPTG